MHPFLYMKAYTTVRHNADLSNSYVGILIKKHSINMDLEIKWIEICLEIELKHKKWQISMILLTVYFQNTSSTSADVTPSIFTETIPLIIWYVTVCVFSNKIADFLYKWLRLLHSRNLPQSTVQRKEKIDNSSLNRTVPHRHNVVLHDFDSWPLEEQGEEFPNPHCRSANNRFFFTKQYDDCTLWFLSNFIITFSST